MDTISKVNQYINDNHLLEDNSKIIVGVSGGADSMALLDILRKLGCECIAAHCNFHLRGEESNRDYRFVKDYCKEKDIPFLHVDFDTFGYMKHNSVSLEMAARELRYEWFEQVRISRNAHRIAVAHHQDDSIETVLINLIRGTGIKGLTGISCVNGNIIRPLLCLSRDEIIGYLSENKIDYVTDSTNNESEYVRNKIRLEVIPLLETINPSVKKSLHKTADNLLSAYKIYEGSVIDSKKRIFSDNKVNIDLLLQEEEPQTILYEILNPYGFNADTIQNIFISLNGISGKRFYSDEYTLLKDRNFLILSQNENSNNNEEIYYIQENILDIDFPVKLRLDTYKNTPSSEIEKQSNIIYLDLDKITYPLIIRRWKQGDKFVPFGMKGSKKLSDYFSDNKFSLVDKENVWLLCSNDEIIWIIGHRADNRFRINENTKQVLRVTYYKKI